jgi:hypothetical protein
MDFVESISRRLSSTEQEALANAVEQVDDFLLGELVELHDGTRPAGTTLFSDAFLPSRYADFYDFAMLRRLHVCLTVVAGRFQDQWEPPRCRGEELVLRAVLDHAETCFEEQTNESTDRFADLRDRLFEDFDHEYRFDAAFDGIDDPETFEGSQLGVQALHPSAWFTPFRTDSPVHPMLP